MLGMTYCFVKALFEKTQLPSLQISRTALAAGFSWFNRGLAPNG